MAALTRWHNWRLGHGKVPMDTRGDGKPSKPPKAFARNVRAEITHGKLRPWMKQFARWLLEQDGLPPKEAMIAQASRFSKGILSAASLRDLRRRLDFKQYCEAISQDAVKRAKEEYESLLPNMAQAAREALEQALLAKDYKAVSQIIQPGIDRFWPKHEDEAKAPQQITIQIGGQSPTTPAVPLLGNETVVEAEFVEDEPSAE